MSHGQPEQSDPTTGPTRGAGRPVCAPKKKRGWLARIARALLVLLVVIVCSLLGGLVYLGTDGGKDFVRRKLTAALQKRFHGTVAIDSLDYDLSGAVVIGGFSVTDASGRRAVSVGRLELALAWRELGGAVVPIERFELSDVSVDVVKKGDGSSNFTDLFISKPIDKTIEIRALRLARIDVRVENPDGSLTVVDDLAISGSIRATPATKDFRVSLDPITLSVAFQKPSGLSIGVDSLRTGLELSLEGGRGTVTVLPLSAEIAADLPTLGKRGFPVRWAGVTLSVGEQGLDVALGELALDAISLRSLDVHGVLEQGALAGAPTGELVGLRVDALKLNQFIGRELLARDVEVGARVHEDAGHPRLDVAVTSGKAKIDLGATLDATDPAAPRHDLTLRLTDVDTSELLGASAATIPPITIGARIHEHAGHPRLDVAVTSGKAKIDFGATLDATDPAAPRHDLTLRLTDVDTSELLGASAATIPPITIGALELRARGTGSSAESIDTLAELDASSLSVRGVPIRSVRGKLGLRGQAITIDGLDLEALGQSLHVEGSFDRATKQIDAQVGVAGDVGELLGGLSRAGLAVSTKLPPGAVVLPKGDLRVDVDGIVGGPLRVVASAKAVRAMGGRAALSANLSLRKGDPSQGETSTVLEGGEATVDVVGLRLSSALGARRALLLKALGVDAALDLHVKASGTRAEPVVDLRGQLTSTRRDGGRRARAELVAHVDHRRANLRLDAVDPESRESLLRLTADLPIVLGQTERGLDPSRPLDVKLSFPRRSVADLASFVPPIVLFGRKLPEAELELELHAFGRSSRPEGRLKLSASGALLAPERRELVSSVALDATLKPGPGSSSAFEGAIDLFIDQSAPRALHASFVVDLPRSLARGALESLGYDAKLELGPLRLAELPDVERFARLRGLGGEVQARAHVHGDRKDLLAELSLEASGLLGRLDPSRSDAAGGPLGLALEAQLGPRGTTLDLRTKLEGQALASLAGRVGLAGEGLLSRLEQGLDPELDLRLELPERSLASLARLSPKLAAMPGRSSGEGKIHGSARHPLAQASLRVGAVPMWSGRDGGAQLELDLARDTLVASLGWGAGEGAPLRLRAEVDRASLQQFSAEGSPLPVLASLEATKVDLRELLPKLVSDRLPVEPSGKLDASLEAHVELGKDEGKTALRDGRLDGRLELRGDVPIPGSKRVLRDLVLRLAAVDDALILHELSARESDHEKKDRSLRLSGRVALAKLRPEHADLRLEARDWLLFGAKSIGMADAPRGSLSAELRVAAELARPVRRITIDVDRLEALFPDRFEKAHQPEDVHLGDVIDVTGEPSLRGKLPVPASVLAARAQAHSASEPTVEAPEAEPTGTDLVVRVKSGARVLQSPIDLTTGGQIEVALRGSERTIRGKLVMTAGELSLGGQMHPLTQGSLLFDEAHPAGHVDLHFEKKLGPWALRGISERSAGHAVKIHMAGPLTDRKTVLSGAGSPGALYDLLAMHNLGRERLVSGPDMPESVTVDFPQHQGLLALSFIAVNLPHLLFLDRTSAWADPYDAPRAYGRIENYEAERYFSGGEGRIKASLRPAGVGRSEAEIELDYLFGNDARWLFGVGVAGGSRGGGGPGLVLEWSSAD